ncbi:probable ATP-dependent RNA helicase DHX40 isoform X2 [Pleurodeles waltl]|uniref:probable ATP-dependent RNA helicase DHX40 isoform X2 n=1 Tax=Pleurodeles waltl TaxID=8319 RepID=UPI00370980D2
MEGSSSSRKEMERDVLPIYEYRKELVQAVKDSNFLIVTGETGSGKTTQLPQYLHKAGFAKHGMIGVTQPRRVATISVALRVAEELNCSLGTTVGYQVRFDDCSSKDTAIKYMTDGCLLRHILADSNLCQYSTIILDEAHERSLSTDILFGLLKKLFQQKMCSGRKRPLKIVVMSATLDIQKLSEFFENCPVVKIPGRTFPVKEIFCNLIGPKNLEGSAYVAETVKVVMDIHLNKMAGDILVFLTGQAEIEKACNLLFTKGESIDYQYDLRDQSVEGLLILPLYGSMATDQQKEIFHPPPAGVRKCVLSTNIAATSLTIPGIRYVVDSGFVKQLNHNPRIGMDILEVVPIAKSEAVQRTGRAGRTSAGVCYRIYSKDFWDQCMPEHMVPEIKRTSLTSVILTLKCLEIHNVIQRGHVTQMGKFMVEYPLPPNMACAVIKAASVGCEDLLLPIAAMLSVENVFIRPGDSEKREEAERKHQALSMEAGGSNDFATLFNIFQQCRMSTSPARWCQQNFVHWRALKSAFSVERQLQEITRRLKQMKDFPREKCEGPRSEMLRRCLCAGYFSNVAKRSAGTTFRTMEGCGTMVKIHPSSALHGQEAELEWIMFHDVLVTSNIFVKTVCPIRYEWVKDLLPKLHEVDVYELSSVAREAVTEKEMAKWNIKEGLKRQNEGALEDALKKAKRRNDETSISDARTRYLQRREQKTENLTKPDS